KNVRPAGDNLLVRCLKRFYLGQLTVALKLRWLAVVLFVGVLIVTGFVAADMGREFMPELEEGNIWARATFPINVSIDEVSARSRVVRSLLKSYPEVSAVVPQIGRPDDGTDPTGYYNVEIFIPLLPEKDWPAPEGARRRRTKEELVMAINADLQKAFPGIDWGFSQNIRDNVMEALSGVKGENSVKIFGPDLDRLEELAQKVKATLADVRGVENPGVFRVQGQSNLEIPVDRQKCARWGVSVTDVQNVIQTAVGGKAVSQMTEGGRSFDITLRFPPRVRRDEHSILNIPVEVTNNQTVATMTGQAPTPLTGGSVGLAPKGTSATPPGLYGSQFEGTTGTTVPRRRLADFVTAQDEDGEPWRYGSFSRPGASTAYREPGEGRSAVNCGRV